MLGRIDHQPGPVRGRRAQDQGAIVGIELAADLFQCLAPGHLLHRALVDIAQQCAELRQRHRRLREQVYGRLVLANLHQHFPLSPLWRAQRFGRAGSALACYGLCGPFLCPDYRDGKGVAACPRLRGLP
ncbi:hypothetical protein D3C72_1759120 [compost metagenome]